MAELPDAVGQHGVCARIAWGQSQQGRRGNERNPIFARAVKPGDDRDALSADCHEPMLRDLNARLCRKCQRKDFTRGNVPRIIRLGKLCDGELFIRQADRRLGARTAGRRTSGQEKTHILGGFSFPVNRIRRSKQRAQAYQGWKLAGRGGKKRALGVEPETQRANTRHVVQRQHIINVTIGFLRQNLLADGALDEGSQDRNHKSPQRVSHHDGPPLERK